MKKINTTLIGGAIGVIMCWAIEASIMLATGTPFLIPSPVAAAFGTVMGYVVSLVTPDDKEE